MSLRGTQFWAHRLRNILCHDVHYKGTKSKGWDEILARGWFETQGDMGDGKTDLMRESFRRVLSLGGLWGRAGFE